MSNPVRLPLSRVRWLWGYAYKAWTFGGIVVIRKKPKPAYLGGMRDMLWGWEIEVDKKRIGWTLDLIDAEQVASQTVTNNMRKAGRLK